MVGAKAFYIGEPVKFRDKGKEWEQGVVVSLDPLHVKPTGWDEAFEWDEVLHQVFTMGTVAPPVLLGGISTLVCVIGLAFSPVPFIVKYFFGTFVATIALGLINALLFLPAYLLFFAMLVPGSSSGERVAPVET